MSGNAQNFPMGSNAHEHPPEVNRQSGARRSRVARAENQPPLPARVVNKSIINGTQLHDYGFMGSWSTSSSFNIHNPTSFYNSSGSTIDTPIGSQLDRNGFLLSNPNPNSQMGFQNEGNPGTLNNMNDIPIQTQITSRGPIGLSQAQHQEDPSALLDSYNIPIRSGLNGNGSARVYTSMQMDQFGQPRFHQGDIP